METIRNIEVEGRHGKPILADVFYKDGRDAKPILIFVHGFKGFKDWGAHNLMARYFSEKRFVFVKFNFSHNGTTPEKPAEFDDLEAFGNNNFETEMDDLGTVLDWICQTPLVPDFQKNFNEIYLIGHSRGGGICILKAAEDARIKKLVTWASVTDFGKHWDDAYVAEWEKEKTAWIHNSRTRQDMPLHYQLYENYIKNKDRFNIEASVKKIEIPFMVVQGTEDDVVTYEEALELKRWNQKIKLDLIPNGNHTFGVKHPFNDLNLPFDAQVVWEHTRDFLKG
jgi:pimeloyl-ACP methyl ester carboxylesterase